MLLSYSARGLLTSLCIGILVAALYTTCFPDWKYLQAAYSILWRYLTYYQAAYNPGIYLEKKGIMGLKGLLSKLRNGILRSDLMNRYSFGEQRVVSRSIKE